MSSLTHFRYEILRTVRNRTFLGVTLALPLGLFYGVASGQRHGTFNGTSFPLYFMTAMAVYGAMFAVVSPGARIARDRSRGWTRQMMITPLRARTDVTAKVVAAYLLALPTLVLLFLAGASLGSGSGRPSGSTSRDCCSPESPRSWSWRSSSAIWCRWTR